MNINNLPLYMQHKFSQHMRTLATLGELEPSEEVRMVLKRTAREINLYLSNFKCEKCQTKDNLTTHHLVYKIQRHYIQAQRYYKQRYYFGNQAILCCDCHNRAHPGSVTQKAEKYIDPKLISKIKKRCQNGTN